MTLDHYSDPPTRKLDRTCECGRRRTLRHACDRCTYLDGHRGAAYIIAALRQAGPMSAPEIAAMNGCKYDDATRKTLGILSRRGRVRRYWRPANDVRDGNRGGETGCWVYALTERL